MNNKENRDITIIIFLLLFVAYMLWKPSYFNKIIQSLCGRFILIILILFISKNNKFFGFITVFFIILLINKNNNSNFVNIKKQKNTKVNPFYNYFTDNWKKIEAFTPKTSMGRSGGGANNTAGTSNSAGGDTDGSSGAYHYNKINDITTDIKSGQFQSSQISQNKLFNNFYGFSEFSKNEEDYFKDKKFEELENSDEKLFINDLINIQNTIIPKNSSTMIASPVFF